MGAKITNNPKARSRKNNLPTALYNQDEDLYEQSNRIKTEPRIAEQLLVELQSICSEDAKLN